MMTLSPPKTALLTKLLLALWALMLASFTVAGSKIVDVRLWQAPDNTRIVFDLASPVEHKIFTLDNPPRVVLDIDNVSFNKSFDALDIKNSPILNIRSAKKGQNNLRVVFDLREQVKLKSFLLRKNAEADDRLVVDLFQKSQSKQVIAKTVGDVKKHNRDLIIAIDAGHGGEDPGAIGPKRIYEKHVVLAIAKKLAAKINREKGYKAVLIRDGDYYIGLAERRNLARKAGADMFISVHADAFTNPQAHGSSVYALSSRGATSATAKFLANKENQSDMVGGVSLSDKDEILSSVLVDLSMTHKMASSMEAGSRVLTHMDKISRLHSRHVEKAAFAVLKTLDIPSLLIETGFISNPGEAKKLASSRYQDKMANAIFSGVHDYFREKAPEDTYIANKYSKQRGGVYVVASGDTLSAIAQRYAVSTQDLRQYNQLSSYSLQIGQKLKIPKH